MQLARHRIFVLFFLVTLSVGAASPLRLLAQEADGCDLDALLEHQREHAATIANLEHALHDDLDAALENLYVTGIAYQALAVECGFRRLEAAAAAHAAEHETDAADDHDRTAILEAARAIGDPENGEILFNAFLPEVGFACATCHRVDSTERLIGPGLWGVGDPEHDPSEHDMDAMDMGATDDHGHGHSEAGTDEATAVPDAGDAGHTMDMHGAQDQEQDHSMDMAEAAAADPVEYIRTSIIDPGAYLVPGFPDHLMPRTYGDIFTEDEINDLVAYLMTLQ